MKKPFCVCIATALLLSACNLVPDYRRPDAETPLQWHDKSLTGQASAVDPQWWQAFGSIELNRPVTEALAYNYDLAAVRQRVEQARAQAKIAGANLWAAAGWRMTVAIGK
ncbi:MAG: hypothetical protein ACXV7J_03710 [Methylomonas sp.]